MLLKPNKSPPPLSSCTSTSINNPDVIIKASHDIAEVMDSEKDSESDFYGRFRKYKCSRSDFIRGFLVFTVLIR